jgi:hypothetical protein
MSEEVAMIWFGGTLLAFSLTPRKTMKVLVGDSQYP